MHSSERCTDFAAICSSTKSDTFWPRFRVERSLSLWHSRQAALELGAGAVGFAGSAPQKDGGSPQVSNKQLNPVCVRLDRRLKCETVRRGGIRVLFDAIIGLKSGQHFASVDQEWADFAAVGSAAKICGDSGKCPVASPAYWDDDEIGRAHV